MLINIISFKSFEVLMFHGDDKTGKRKKIIRHNNNVHEFQ